MKFWSGFKETVDNGSLAQCLAQTARGLGGGVLLSPFFHLSLRICSSHRCGILLFLRAVGFSLLVKEVILGAIPGRSPSSLLTPDFYFQDHLNFYCTGSSLGNLLLSIKCEEAEGIEYLRIILRWGCCAVEATPLMADTQKHQSDQSCLGVRGRGGTDRAVLELPGRGTGCYAS